MIQGTVVLNYPEYISENWHGTLLTIAISLFGVFFNTTLAKKLPVVEGLVLIIHIFAFFGILVTLWVLAPRHSASDVFAQFTDGGNWDSLGVATLVGVSSGTTPLLGADAATHMAEEIRDAGRNIPLAILLTTALNGLMGKQPRITTEVLDRD
jgi:choline transport protein